jgi:HEAT repeat protein
LFDDVYKLFDASSAEEVRFEAAFALGNISLGNVEQSLSRIIALIKKQANQQFLLFITLKEVIIKLSTNAAQEILNKVAPEIWNILFLNTETVQQETSRNAIAECLGKISQFDAKTYLPLLRTQISSGSAHTRSTALMALRHTFNDPSSQLGEFDSILASVMPDFIVKVDDQDQVKFLNLNQSLSRRPLLRWLFLQFITN